MSLTTSNRTARDIALEGLSIQQRAKLLEWADLHNIPNDDSIYWMAVMLRPEPESDAQQQRQQQILTRLDAVEEGLSLIASTLEASANSRRQQRQESREGRYQLAGIRFWVQTLLPTGIGVMLGAGCLVWAQGGAGSQKIAESTGNPLAVEQPIADPTRAVTPSTATQPGPAQTAPAESVLLDQLAEANRDRLKHCQAGGNTKCTLLIKPEG